MSSILAIATEAQIELSSAIHRLEHGLIESYHDLKLFGALVLAHVIVWRILRRRGVVTENKNP